jgi:Ser/Thr protein kinase RdoA (MazF antagonist)
MHGERPVAPALAAWHLERAQVEEIHSGHINRTWRVSHGAPSFVLQWVNPIFGPEVNDDIEAVTRWLENKGIPTPRLVPTREGRLWLPDDQGGVWRLMTYFRGATLLAADSAKRCHEAGRLLGQFHLALWDCEYQLQHQRLRVHDLDHHLERLTQAVQDHCHHEAFSLVEPVAGEIVKAAHELELAKGLPLRLVHGDPKISNVIFGDDGRARCLVDLDTLARMPLIVELGDAFRSWCTPLGEDVEAPFQLDFFEAGLSGYGEGLGPVANPSELEALPFMVEAIAVELAARFCADALMESYFAWDPGRFASASEHNLRRARAQLFLSRSIRQQRASLARITSRL